MNSIFTIKLDLDNPEITEYLGKCIGNLYLSLVKRYDMYIPLYLMLNGEVGSGKSCIARAMINYLTHEDIIPSPSYLICLSYKYGKINIHHIDPYRIKSSQSLNQFIDIEKIMNDVIILEHSDKSKIVDKFDQKYVIKIDIQGKILYDILTDNISVKSLSSLGRSIKISVYDNCIYDINILYDMFIKTDLSTDNMISNLSDKLEKEDIYAKAPYHTILRQKIISEPQNIIIMGVETSCDDTCISCIDGQGKIILNYQIGQNHIHKEYGGVHPSFAKKAHVENLNHYMELALKQTYNSHNKYPDVIAYTIGPGLEICLSTGVMKVYEVSQKYKIPIIPTHHIESHIMVCRLPDLKFDISYPFISCVISGGHTFICYVESEGVYKLLSTTVDDSMGEVIDKVGRELGISDIPAGKDFEKLAINGNKCEYIFPHPHIKGKPYDLSFSGLKFAGIDTIKKIKMSDNMSVTCTANFAANFAASFQDHIFNYMISQFKKVYENIIELKTVNCIVLAGGVVSNMILRSKMDDFGKKYNIKICYPPPNLCTDNGIMVAWNGIEKLKSGFILPPIAYFDPMIKYDVRSRWKLWY